MRYVAEAAIQVLQDRKDIIWWLVGKEGPESAYCRQIIQEANLQSRILMLGQRNDIPALLRQSEFQVVGSLAEGLGLMVLEAAACGVPTIGTQIGGLNETIIDGETGLLVESCSSTVLADATLWMLEHPEKKTIMGIAAKQYIAEKFDSESQILHLLEMFTQDYGRRKLRRGN
jgi:glycosyltransferase involved in cell wall biosynthesis